MAARRPEWLFVVKLWAETRANADEPPVWRGRVDDVRQGTRRYFSSLAQLREYLSDRVDGTLPDVPAADGPPTPPARPRRRRRGPRQPATPSGEQGSAR